MMYSVMSDILPRGRRSYGIQKIQRNSAITPEVCVRLAAHGRCNSADRRNPIRAWAAATSAAVAGETLSFEK
jgi:hypothetical protein